MPAFLMTWSTQGWPYAELRALVAKFEQAGTAREPWRIRAHRRVRPGDRAILLRQGKGTRGIFGIGTVVGTPFLLSEMGQPPKHVVDVEFETLVDPLRELLVTVDQLQGVMPTHLINTQSSGQPIDDDILTKLAPLLRSAAPRRLPSDETRFAQSAKSAGP